LSFIRTFVDNDLALSVSRRNLARPLVQARPIQPGQWSVVEMALNDLTDEGRLAISMGARQIELATTIYGAIAVIVGFTLE
jgi:hypothetical protein